MKYVDALEAVARAINGQGFAIDPDDYSAVFIKRIPASDVHPALPRGTAAHTYHIAITGDGRGLFPHLSNPLYLEMGEEEFKSRFVQEIPVLLFRKNIEYLLMKLPAGAQRVLFAGGGETIRTRTISKRAERTSGGYQIELSDKVLDGPDFDQFRRLLYEGDYMIFLQREGKLDFSLLGIKGNDAIVAGLNRLEGLHWRGDKVTVQLRLLNLRKEAKKRKLQKILEWEIKCNPLDFTEGLYFPLKMKEKINNSVASALKRGHIILIGPPGTGKTKIAENIAKSLRGRGGYVFTTATADWTTFDTVGGYHPREGGRGLEFRPGQFIGCFKEGDDPASKWLVIDEMNRADIDKAFGQMLSVLSGYSVELPFKDADGRPVSLVCVKRGEVDDSFEYSDSSYHIADSWRIIATLNTYDKASLYEMSYAFMRRFAFVEIGIPKIEDGIVEKYLKESDWGLKKEEVRKFLGPVERIWRTFNETGREIGPAIIRDVLLFLKEYKGDLPLTSTIELYVLPQLEGMDRGDVIRIIKALLGVLGDLKEGDALIKTASGRFGISVEKLKGEM